MCVVVPLDPARPESALNKTRADVIGIHCVDIGNGEFQPGEKYYTNQGGPQGAQQQQQQPAAQQPANYGATTGQK